jgi:ring-1,2-phenylacetyl-CoA epoxidase subunit PaaD
MVESGHKDPRIERVYRVLSEVCDPEIPVLTIEDMGIVRKVEMKNETLHITITPTYSGCPAMDTIEADIRTALKEAKYAAVEIDTVIDPPWTTEWMSESGKRKLEEYGIAPPDSGSSDKRSLFGKSPLVKCPRCRSENTEVVSMFGSTACKALYKCKDCQEPFDYFKCI